jgi:RNA polymerase sigma-70 factor (ECF subfamily)
MADEQRSAVATALAALEPNQQAVVRLSFYDGLSHGEIAEKLGRPLGTVKTQVRQGLLRMRDALRAHWEGRKANP